ncbi:uncharacterized protein A4U43_C08F16660 [Asparagus officinalis]|nr:uncharacterized protein A4U43_C08F16660 [Asparagus officinalis]
MRRSEASWGWVNGCSIEGWQCCFWGRVGEEEEAAVQEVKGGVRLRSEGLERGGGCSRLFSQPIVAWRRGARLANRQRSVLGTTSS